MIAFFMALPHTEYDSLWEFLCNYTNPLNKLVLAKETSKKSHKDISGQHFHILVEWEKNTYEAFKKTIIDKHYQLCGRSTTGNSRKYGQVRGIKDIDKMLIYTIKHGDFRYQNYTKEEIKEAYEQSYIKEDKRAFMEDIIEHLYAQDYQPRQGNIEFKIPIAKIEYDIVVYWMNNNDKVITRNTLHHILLRFLTQKWQYRNDNIQEIIYIIKK